MNELLVSDLKRMIKEILYPILIRFKYKNRLPFRFRWFGKKEDNRGNILLIGASSKLRNSSIRFAGSNCQLIIEGGCNLNGCKFLLQGNGSKIIIKSNTVINAYPVSPTVINSCEGKQIEIGEKCLFSNGIEIHNSDYHSIFNSSNERINKAKDIKIGNHVWIGLQSLILKGSVLPDNTIVGAFSVITNQFLEDNCIIAGNPGKVVRRDVYWSIKLFDRDFSDTDSKSGL